MIDAISQTAHPRCLMTPERRSRLRAIVAEDAVARQWRDWLEERAEALLTLPLLRAEDQTLERQIYARLPLLSLMALLDGGERYRARLWEQAEIIAEMDDWTSHPGHPYALHTAEMCVGMAVTLDWHYDSWSAAQRQLMTDALCRKGLERALEVYRRPAETRYWPDRDNNWNFVCNCGVICAAVTVADKAPELAEACLTEALASIPTATAVFAPDGAWMEGTRYWHYGVSFLCKAADALTTATGSDQGLLDVPGMEKTAAFVQHMIGPSGLHFNYSDSSARSSAFPQLLYLARHFNDPVAVDLEHRTIAQVALQPETITAAQLGVEGVAPHTLDLLWYMPCPETVERPPLNACLRGREIDVVSLRRAWDDPNVMWLAAKGGAAAFPHAHLDAGNFVFEALGERWAIELGSENYGRPGYFETYEGGPRGMYRYYRIRPEGHNTLVLDSWIGGQQMPYAHAAVTAFDGSGEEPFAVMDLSACYQLQKATVWRGFKFLTGGRLLIQDEVTCEAGLEFHWFWHTRAEIEIASDARQATMTQNGKQLHFQLLADPAFSFMLMDAVPLPNSPSPEQTPNDGVRKLVVYGKGIAHHTLAIVVTPVIDNAVEPTSPQITPVATWS